DRAGGVPGVHGGTGPAGGPFGDVASGGSHPVHRSRSGSASGRAVGGPRFRSASRTEEPLVARPSDGKGAGGKDPLLPGAGLHPRRVVQALSHPAGTSRLWNGRYVSSAMRRFMSDRQRSSSESSMNSSGL